MAVIPFNSLQYVDQLKADGVEAKQAEAQARALSQVFEKNLDDLATKHDISDLRKDMQAMEGRFEAKLVDIKFELIKWVIGIGIAQVALLVGLLTKMH